MATVISKEDRQFQLLLALISSRSGMTKNEILKSVRGYAEASESTTQDSLERMFERDKDDIRDLGAIIETIEPLGQEGETHNVMYRISPEAFSFPESVRFSSQEMSWLDLAAQAWQAASLSAASKHALTKLKSLGVDSDTSLVGIAPNIRTVDRAFGDLQVAIEDNFYTEFDYLKPGDAAPTSRRVAPLALANVHGHWFLYGFDDDRSDFRTFLLPRIIGKVRVMKKNKHNLPRADYAQTLIDDLTSVQSTVTAIIALQPGTEASIALPHRYAAQLGDNTVTLSHFDEDLLADDLTPFIDEISIISPSSLREKVRERLTRMVENSAHGNES